METWNDPRIDRSTWGEGPWDGEPDVAEWIDGATGYLCFARRGSGDLGSWCGYVAVPPEHPLYGVDYDDVQVEAHGGLTFSEEWQRFGLYVFGFDCAHSGDLIPGLFRFRELFGDTLPNPPGTYRTLDFVRAECTALAAQLQAVATREDDAPSLPPTPQRPELTTGASDTEATHEAPETTSDGNHGNTPATPDK